MTQDAASTAWKLRFRAKKFKPNELGHVPYDNSDVELDLETADFLEELAKSSLTEVQKEKLKIVCVHLIAATSAYDQYAKGDAVKQTRLMDFRKASEKAHELYKELF